MCFQTSSTTIEVPPADHRPQHAESDSAARFGSAVPGRGSLRLDCKCCTELSGSTIHLFRPDSCPQYARCAVVRDGRHHRCHRPQCHTSGRCSRCVLALQRERDRKSLARLCRNLTVAGQRQVGTHSDAMKCRHVGSRFPSLPHCVTLVLAVPTPSRDRLPPATAHL